MCAHPSPRPRGLLLAIALTIGAVACSPPAEQAPPREMFPGTRQELLGIREAVWRAWFANDTMQLAEFLDPRFLSIPPTGDQWHGLKEVLLESAGFVASGGKLVRIAFPRTHIESFGPLAVLHSTYRFDLDQGGTHSTLAGRLTEVFELRDDRWVYTSRHLDNDP